MKNFDKDNLNTIRNISITQLLEITNSNNFTKKMIRCPFHNDKTPSFVLYPDNSYYCFGCNKHGKGAIDFVMDLGYSFEDACLELKKYI